MSENLQAVIDRVVRLAQRQGYVVPTDVKDALLEDNLPADQWKEVIAQAGDSLRYQNGRYYFNGPVSETARLLQEKEIEVERAVRELVRECRAEDRRNERRNGGRVVLIQSVLVRDEDGREMKLITRDISPTGIRLIGTHRLLGKKVDVCIAAPINLGEDGPVPSWTFSVRILWTCEVGDQLFENGGALLEVTSNDSGTEEEPS